MQVEKPARIQKNSWSFSKKQTKADDEAKEKAKTEKAKTSTREKIEFELKVTLGKGGEIDISAPFKKVVDGVKMLLNSPVENLQQTVEGKKNSNDGKHAEPSAEDRAAVEKIKQRKQREGGKGAKIAADKLKENEREIRRLKKDKNADSGALQSALNRRRDLQVKATQKADIAGFDIKRDILTFDIIKPNFKFTASWYMEGSKSKNDLFKHQVANIVDGTFEATPLIGLTITLDLLACAQRAHPALLAFIAACDIALGLIGGDSEMAFNIKASGDIKGTISFTLNTLTKEKKLGKDAKLSSTMKLIIEAHIIAVKKIEVLKITTILTGGVKSVEGGFELGIAAEARWLAEGNIDADEEGIFMDTQWSFEGLEFSGYATIYGKVSGEKDENGEQNTYKTESKAEFKYIAIDKQESHPLGKFYLNHTS